MAHFLVGQKFGELTVLKRTKVKKSVRWVCKCSCGKKSSVTTSNLMRGNTTSCGAPVHRGTHQLSNKRIYIIWRYMMSRCYYPTASGYENYGGRGIKVCKRWHNVANFAADVGEPPDKKTLDRIDNDKGYKPGNVRWATWTEQMNNRRDNVHVTAFGQTKPLAVWCKEYKMKTKTLWNRLFRTKMKPEDALTMPLYDMFRKKRPLNSVQ